MSWLQFLPVTGWGTGGVLLPATSQGGWAVGMGSLEMGRGRVGRFYGGTGPRGCLGAGAGVPTGWGGCLAVLVKSGVRMPQEAVLHEFLSFGQWLADWTDGDSGA